MRAGRALIAQSGGPTAVINASLVGAVREALDERRVFSEFWGSLNAVEGLLRPERGLIDLFAQSKEGLDLIATTPGAALGSSRKKIGSDEGNIREEDVFEALKKKDIRYFFYIGGNDSADNAKTIRDIARRENYEMFVYHIPKTVDNDLMENDHTPGYGSAAKLVAAIFQGEDRDNASLPGVKINVCMGRNSGFLTAASCLGKELGRAGEDKGPHLIYLPEVDFDTRKFLREVEIFYRKYGRVLVAVSEGIHDDKGILIGWDGVSVDGHGNPELDSKFLASKLEKLVKTAGITKRVRADSLGYLQRSFPYCVSEQDREEAEQAGRFAVKLAVDEEPSCSIAIKRTIEEGDYSYFLKEVEFEKVARLTRTMPAEFIDAEISYVTPAFRDYALPLIGKNLDGMARLEMKFVD